MRDFGWAEDRNGSKCEDSRLQCSCPLQCRVSLSSTVMQSTSLLIRWPRSRAQAASAAHKADRLGGLQQGAPLFRYACKSHPRDLAILTCAIDGIGPWLPRQNSHRWHTEALGSSAQIRCVSLSCCRYRVMTKSASRVARIIQMLMRIRAAQQPRCPRRARLPGSIRATFRHDAPRVHHASLSAAQPE